jgi:CRP/FNR family transcriptional regulator, cyclic AMP receptor protein
MIYFIEKGQVKLVLPGCEGKQCLVSIRPPGDIFGELCLSGQSARLETAVAMKECSIKRTAARDFMLSMRSNALLESLIQYLAAQVSEQLEIIGALTMTDSEHRLAKTLLHLGRLLGNGDLGIIQIQQKISNIDLSAMIGTTRSRVGTFLKKFRQLGLVRISAEGYLIIEQQKIRQYLQSENEQKPPRPLCSPSRIEAVFPNAP